MKIDYCITAFKDQHGDIFVSDSLTEQVHKISNIKNHFIEELYYELMNDEQLESMLLYCLDEITKRSSCED